MGWAPDILIGRAVQIARRCALAAAWHQRRPARRWHDSPMCARGEPVALGSIRYRMLTLWRLPKWRRAAAAMGWLLAAAFATLAAVVPHGGSSICRSILFYNEALAIH